MREHEFVQHVLDHYIARDRYRIALIDYVQRTSPNVRGIRWDFNQSEYPHVSMRGHLLKDEVHKTRMQLMGLKVASLEQLHMALHQHYPVLDMDEHFHVDNDAFRYIIREMP